MKNENIEELLNNMEMPKPENIVAHPGLKIPLLSYRKSSRAGLWLLLVPLVVAIAAFVKTELHLQSGVFESLRPVFSFIDNNAVLTFLIPLIFIGLPLTVMVINVLAICHFQQNAKSKELVITIKYRVWNIVLIFLSLAVLVFFLLPDKLAF